MEQLKQQLQAAGIPYRENEPLAAHCTFKIGGPAQVFVQPEREEQLCRAIALCKQQRTRYYVLGNGSNILFADEGYQGAVLDVSALHSVVEVNGTTLCAGAGVRLSTLCKAALEHALTGLEFAYGIPGTVGGAVYMNAGAYGGEMKDVLIECRHIDSDGNLGSLKGEELGLSYRTSAYEHNGYIITTLVMKLKKGDKTEIKAKMQELLQRRKDKQPLEYPSAGSTFKRPVGYFAGGLIEECGLKGCSVGGAQVSEKHAGFIINKGGATAQDVLDLIKYVQDRVYEERGIHLEPEVRLITVG